MNKKSYIPCLAKAIFSLLCIISIAYNAKAQCPNNTFTVNFNAYDTTTNNLTSSTNSLSLTCGAKPFRIEADNSSYIVTPCVLSAYHMGLLSGACADATETFYEGGTDVLCVGPSASCVYPVGGGSGVCTLGGYWAINKIYLDPSQQHTFQFCDPNSLNLGGISVQLQDCWSGDPLSPSKSFSGLITPGNSCFADTVAANTDIGTASYSIAPATASVALTDNHNGRSVVNPALLPSGSYTVSYSFTPPLADGCQTVTGTFKFTIAPIPLSVNSPTICAGNTATLTASGPPAVTYSWSPATNLSATTGSVVSTNTLSNTAIYTVTATKATCTATATSTITVNLAPTLTLSSASICAGSTVSLTAQGATNYTWTPSTGLSTTTGSVVTATTPSTTVYTVTGNSGGCSSSAILTVTVNPIPTLTISVSSATICAGNTTTLTASGTATSYSWSTGATSATITPSPTLTATYTATGTTGGCSIVKTTTVAVNQTPTVTVNSPTICAGTTATLTANGASTYTWNTSATTATISVSLSATTNTYAVTGTDIHSCKNTATSTVTVNQTPTVTVNSPTICAGATATLTANGANTYTWSTSATGISITPSPTTTAHYTVTGTDANSCRSSATSTVTVNFSPTITVNSPTICVGATTTLTANGANTYTWSTSAIGINITPSPTITTHYTVTGTDANSCKNTATSTVTVNSLPTITVNSPTICAGATATLTANGASTYTWSTSAISVSITPSPITTAHYTVTGTDVNNCKNIATSAVSVNSLPTVAVNSPTICVGTMVALTAIGASTYTWNTNATNATINISPTTTTHYTVTGIDANSCKNTATSIVTVNQTPTVTVNSPNICVGATATLTASGASTYSWSTSGTSATISVLPAATHTYEVIGTDIHACKNIAIATVIVNPLPTISINTATICEGNSATLIASGASTYTWNTSTTGAVITVTPTLLTTYTVIGIDIHACINSATTTVYVNPLPVVTPTVNTPVCIGQTIKFNANSIGSIIYNWSGPNGYTSSSQNPIITNAIISNAGTYTLSITATGCTVSNTLNVVVDAMPTIANAGVDTITYSSSLSLNGNIPVVGAGIWSVISGSGNFLNAANANTQVTNLQSGPNVLKWTISNGACPDSYDELTIIVKDLIIPNGFSPNGDGVNDVFEINGLEEYTNVKINVFNRWGNLVYDSGDYKNNWNGKNMSGEDLSDDTYFFTIEIPTKTTVKGYVILKRK